MKLLLAFFVVLLAGCGSWSRPNTTEAQFNSDRYMCQSQAAQLYPVQIFSSPGPTSPSYTSCRTYYGQTSCTTTPGVQYPGTQTDVNALARAASVTSCLQANGYAYSFKGQVADASPAPACTGATINGVVYSGCK
nr:hypothetical protein [uncultured Albidiferax sp.]